MDPPDDPPTEPADPLALGQAAALRLSAGEWQLDADEMPPLEEAQVEAPANETPALETPALETPAIKNTGGLRPPLGKSEDSADVPPSPEQLIEAMLFVGGHPLTAAVACSAVRGLTADRFQAAVDALNRRYRDQRRPYAVETRADGFSLAVRPAYRNLRERIFGGPRETRLSQPALDVLSVVAYRQPVGKAEVDAIRGTDSGATLRQLVRLGLVAVQHRAEAAVREVRYGTSPRFLQVFGLASLDELPRLGEPQQG